MEVRRDQTMLRRIGWAWNLIRLVCYPVMLGAEKPYYMDEVIADLSSRAPHADQVFPVGCVA